MIVCYQYNHIQNIRKQTFIFYAIQICYIYILYKEKRTSIIERQGATKISII